MRLFIAIHLPDEIRAHLTRIAENLKFQISSASFTRPENFRITLKFLGQVEPKRLGELKESLGLVRVSGAIDIFAEKIECFPNRGPVRIVAAGFGGSISARSALHQAIEQRCRHLGFERENRKYCPHVTLARARPTLPNSVRSIATQAATLHVPGPEFGVQEFALVQSDLGPQGSRYEIIERFPILASGDSKFQAPN